MSERVAVNLRIPKAFSELFRPWRFKVYYGGRGGAKSWNFANAIIARAMSKKTRVLCARELQKSIDDSVHALLKNRIHELGVDYFFKCTNSEIEGLNGSLFSFIGLKHNPTKVRSVEGVDICWVEEADAVSDASWEVLIPTIRKDDSEIWICFNPRYPTDPTWKRFVAEADEDIYVRKVGWQDNPFFGGVLEKERQRLLRRDPEAYKHVWEGEFDTRYFGGVYAKWVAEAQAQKRFIKGLHDPSLPVYTAWDLGFDDATAIWIWQVARNEVRLLEYYENSGEDTEFYCKLLLGEHESQETGDEERFLKKSYNYAGHYVPHDAAHQLQAAGGRSIYQQMLRYGLKNVHIIPATGHQNSIEAARTTLKVSWFDSDNTLDGVAALMQYRYEYDEDKKIFKTKPNHNWASHAADAFELIGQVWKMARPDRPPELTIAQKMAIKPTFNDLLKISRQERLRGEDE